MAPAVGTLVFMTGDVLSPEASRFLQEAQAADLDDLVELLGHLKKFDKQGALAWLQGKLLVACLIEKLILTAERISPWGYAESPGKQAESAALMHMLVSRACNPTVSLAHCLGNWQQIRFRLAEAHRQRVYQCEEFEW